MHCLFQLESNQDQQAIGICVTHCAHISKLWVCVRVCVCDTCLYVCSWANDNHGRSRSLKIPSNYLKYLLDPSLSFCRSYPQACDPFSQSPRHKILYAVVRHFGGSSQYFLVLFFFHKALVMKCTGVFVYLCCIAFFFSPDSFFPLSHNICTRLCPEGNVYLCMIGMPSFHAIP